MPIPFSKSLAAATFTAALATTTTSVQAQTPTELTCDLVAAAMKSNESLIAATRDILENLSDKKFRSIAGPLESLPSDFVESHVSEIANVGDLLVVHFAVVRSESVGNVYFRVAYEKANEGYVGVKYSFDSDHEDLFEDWTTLQALKPVNCP